MNRKIIAAVIAAIVIASLLTAAQPSSAAGCVTIPAAAHRGGTERYTENSRNAFRDATNVGVKIWETDVQFTSDNIPIVMHDDTVDRTTDGTGTIADLTEAQIAGMRTDDDEPVPTLAELVNDAAVDSVTVLVELKTNPTPEQWVTLVAALGSRPGMTAKLIITSFDTAALAGAATYAPAYARGLVQDIGDVDPAAVTPYAHILIKHHNAITAARMTKWVAGGLQVYSWTVDTVSEMDRMSWYPAIAGVITNLPQGYLAWQKSRVC